MREPIRAREVMAWALVIVLGAVTIWPHADRYFASMSAGDAWHNAHPECPRCYSRYHDWHAVGDSRIQQVPADAPAGCYCPLCGRKLPDEWCADSAAYPQQQ